MKSNLILLFILLVSVTPLKLTNNQVLFSLSKDSRSYSSVSKLGKLLLDMGSLSQLDGQFDELYTALNLLIDSLKEQITSEDTNFIKSSKAHSDLLAIIQSSLDNAQKALSESTDKLENNLNPALETENIKINDINKRISDSEDLKSNAKTSRQIEHASNLEKIDDLDVAINAIEEAIKILDSLVNSDGNASFLQIKTNFFKQKKENIKKSFAKIKKNFFANVLLEAFSTIETDQNFTNQKLLKEVIDLLNELKTEFQTQKISVQVFETQQQDLYEKYDKNLDDLIKAENNALINSRNEVKRLDEEILNETAIKNLKTQEIIDLTKDKQREIDLWTEKETNHNNLISQYNDEIKTVEEAIDLFKKGGIAPSN